MLLITVKLTLLYAVFKCNSSSIAVKSTKPVIKRFVDNTIERPRKSIRQTIQMINEFVQPKAAYAKILFNNRSSEQKLGVLEIASDENGSHVIRQVKRRGGFFREDDHGNDSGTTYIATIKMDDIDFKKSEPLQLQCLENFIPESIKTECTMLTKFEARQVAIEQKFMKLGLSDVPIFSDNYFLLLELDILETSIKLSTLALLNLQATAYPKTGVIHSRNLELLEFLQRNCLVPPTIVHQQRLTLWIALETVNTLIEALNAQNLTVIGRNSTVKTFRDGLVMRELIEWEASNCFRITNIVSGKDVYLCKAGKKMLHSDISADLKQLLTDFVTLITNLHKIRTKAENYVEISLTQFGLTSLLTQGAPIRRQHVRQIKAQIKAISEEEGKEQMEATRHLDCIVMIASQSVNPTDVMTRRPFLLCSIFYKMIVLIQYKADIVLGTKSPMLRGFSDDSGERQLHNFWNSPTADYYLRFMAQPDHADWPMQINWINAIFVFCQQSHRENLDYGTCITTDDNVRLSTELLNQFHEQYDVLTKIFLLITPETLSNPDEDTVSFLLKQLNGLMEIVISFVEMNIPKPPIPQTERIGIEQFQLFRNCTEQLLWRLVSRIPGVLKNYGYP